MHFDYSELVTDILKKNTDHHQNAARIVYYQLLIIFFNSTKSKMESKQSKSEHLVEIKRKVSFDTNVSIDTRGVISITSKIKNRNPTSKRNVSTVVRFMNNGEALHTITLDECILYGTITAAFIPGKRSSIVLKKFSSMSFDNVTIQDPVTIGRKVAEMDSEISKVAANLRKMKIISEENSSELRELAEKLSVLKSKRSKRLDDLQLIGKFDAVVIDITHNIL